MIIILIVFHFLMVCVHVCVKHQSNSCYYITLLTVCIPILIIIHNFNDAYKILLLRLFGEPCHNHYTIGWIIGNCPLVYWFLEMYRYVSMCF